MDSVYGDLLKKLYFMAEDEGIQIFDIELPHPKAASLRNERIIGLDRRKIGSIADECYCVAHELGHFFEDAFYFAGSSLFTKTECEMKADGWAARAIIDLLGKEG